MPYAIHKVRGGYKVVEKAGGNRPGHEFSKKPQSHARALAQLRALMVHTKG